ncbi:MAG: haloalkane dehalogenase [Pseudomonadota bacterium]
MDQTSSNAAMSAAEMPKRFMEIDGLKMAYVDTGVPPGGGPVIWFQHGNPTSSYLWRNVIAKLQEHARCIAPDLIGMGDSAKLPESGPDAYSFQAHFDHVAALMDALAPGQPLILVLHDWGSALGFHFAQRQPSHVAAIAYMEALVQPVTWADWPDDARDIFQAMRSPAGEDLVLEKNIFVDRILPSAIIRDLSAAEMAVYRRPFLLKGEDRRPTLSWPREIPIEGAPTHMAEIANAYGQFMRNAECPKLFINAEPGSILVGAQRDVCRSWANQEEVTVPGKHFLQEDSGPQIGDIILKWAQSQKLL